MTNKQEQLGLKFAARNMTPVYELLTETFSATPEMCPTYYRMKELPVPYLRTENNVLISTGQVRVADLIKADVNANASIGFGQDAWDLYRVALIIKKELGIHSLPQIVPIELLPAKGRGVTLQDEKNITRLIGIKSAMTFLDKIKTLAHEMRHAHQHEYYHPQYFTNYSFDLQYNDLREYYLQSAEIDAEAYSFIFTNRLLGLNQTMYMRKEYDDVNEAVNKRIKEILDSEDNTVSSHFN